jgi:hypothetical protein
MFEGRYKLSVTFPAHKDTAGNFTNLFKIKKVPVADLSLLERNWLLQNKIKSLFIPVRYNLPVHFKNMF